MSQIEEKVRKVINSIFEEKYPTICDIKIKPLNSNGASIASLLFDATIITPEENIEVFVKVPHLEKTFETERFVYSSLLTAYEKLQDKHGLSEQKFVFPKHFKSSKIDGASIIVLEHLGCKGYDCYDRFMCINWKYASTCVERLARYHALSLALKNEDPEEFEKAGKAMKWMALTGPEWDGAANAGLAAVEEVDRKKLAKFFQGSKGFSKLEDFYIPIKTPVIVHGDYRTSNLMHKEENGKLDVIPIDYQGARLGCPAADLIYFMLTGTDQQFRQQYFHHLIDHYYEQLALAMRSLGLVPEETYGREEFDSDMKQKLSLGPCVAALTLPLTLVSAAEAPSFADERFVPVTSTNELFVERFRGLVDDFKQWGFT